MSMSVHVEGFRPPDDKWEAMRAVWLACENAGVRVPAAVLAFFDGEEPDPAGVTLDLAKETGIKEVTTKDGTYYQLDVRRLPPDVHLVRFRLSY